MKYSRVGMKKRDGEGFAEGESADVCGGTPKLIRVNIADGESISSVQL